MFVLALDLVHMALFPRQWSNWYRQLLAFSEEPCIFFVTLALAGEFEIVPGKMK
jgi:hypothetical protein